MGHRLLLTIILLSVGSVTSAQQFKSFNWIDFQQDKTVKLQGQGWGKETKNRFDRLPAVYENIVRKEVWNLSRNSAGIYLDFYTTADSIALQYKYENREAMKNMSSIGVSGMDLYALTKAGEWIWVKGKYVSFKKEDMVIVFDELNADRISLYRLYFPLYNTISNFRIGLSNNSTLKVKVNTEKPVIVYGTSIAQGASASRSGMAWTSVLGRRISNEVINLGFSANGRLEEELVDLIAKKESSVYIIDCLPNLVAFTDEEVYQRLVYALNKLRSYNPKTPIIFAEHALSTIGLLNNSSQKEYQRVNKNLNKFITDHVRGRDKNVFVVKAEDINLGIESTVDGIHPSDFGMLQYADAYEKLIKELNRGK